MVSVVCLLAPSSAERDIWSGMDQSDVLLAGSTACSVNRHAACGQTSSREGCGFRPRDTIRYKQESDTRGGDSLCACRRPLSKLDRQMQPFMNVATRMTMAKHATAVNLY